MKNVRDTLNLKHGRSLRLGLLLLSTLFIVSASALVYAGIVYERALDVGTAGGATTGSGSTSAGLTPATIMMMAVAACVIGLSLFGLLRQASKHVSNIPGGQGSSPTGPVSMPPGAMGMDLPLRPPSMRGKDWEESPKKEEGEE